MHFVFISAIVPNFASLTGRELLSALPVRTLAREAFVSAFLVLPALKNPIVENPLVIQVE